MSSENEKKSCWICTLIRTGSCVIHAVWWKQRLSTCRELDLKKNLKIKVKQWCCRPVNLAEILINCNNSKWYWVVSFGPHVVKYMPDPPRSGSGHHWAPGVTLWRQRCSHFSYPACLRSNACDILLVWGLQLLLRVMWNTPMKKKKSELPSPGSVLEPCQRKRPNSCGSLARSLSRSGCGGEVVCGPGSVQGWTSWWFNSPAAKTFFSFLFDTFEVTWEGHLLGEVFQACLTWWRPPGQTQDVLERFMSACCFGNALVCHRSETVIM